MPNMRANALASSSDYDTSERDDMTKHKHISQLNKKEREQTDQDIRNVLLTIVAQQGRPVVIPYNMTLALAHTSILKFEKFNDPKTGQVMLRLEAQAR